MKTFLIIMVPKYIIFNRKSYLAIYQEKPQNPTKSYPKMTANYRKKAGKNRGLARAKRGPSVLLMRPFCGSLR